MKLPEQAMIDRNVYAYKQVNLLVYTYGAIGYTIVNTSTYQIKQYRDSMGNK